MSNLMVEDGSWYDILRIQASDAMSPVRAVIGPAGVTTSINSLTVSEPIANPEEQSEHNSLIRVTGNVKPPKSPGPYIYGTDVFPYNRMDLSIANPFPGQIRFREKPITSTKDLFDRPDVFGFSFNDKDFYDLSVVELADSFVKVSMVAKAGSLRWAGAVDLVVKNDYCTIVDNPDVHMTTNLPTTTDHSILIVGMFRRLFFYENNSQLKKLPVDESSKTSDANAGILFRLVSAYITKVCSSTGVFTAHDTCYFGPYVSGKLMFNFLNCKIISNEAITTNPELAESALNRRLRVEFSSENTQQPANYRVIDIFYRSE